MVSTVFDGPSDETWTHDLLTPSQARYQLRHTRILFCYAKYINTLFIDFQEFCSDFRQVGELV